MLGRLLGLQLSSLAGSTHQQRYIADRLRGSGGALVAADNTREGIVHRYADVSVRKLFTGMLCGSLYRRRWPCRLRPGELDGPSSLFKCNCIM